jgi:hypothetical protein
MVWTFEQAQKAGLTGKDNWKNYPRAMLRARCIAEGVRAVYPAAIGGLMVSEEAQDMPPIPAAPKQMGKAQEVEPEENGELLADATKHAAEGEAILRAWWTDQTPEVRATLKSHLSNLKAQAKAADVARTVPAVDDFVAELDAAEVQP